MPKPGARRAHSTLTVNPDPSPNISKLIDIERYSSLWKLLRVTAYVLKFMRKLKGRLNINGDDDFRTDNDEELTTAEINIAVKIWLLSEQSLLKSDKRFEKREKSLKLYHDEQGIVHSRTKISESFCVKFNPKHPILLRDRRRFT